MKPLDLFLTKEAFNEYSKRLREQTAQSYGMTLEQWDAAVLGQHVVTQSFTQQPQPIKSEPCLHTQCPTCKGSGFNLETGEPCVHFISCTCPKCSPRY